MKNFYIVIVVKLQKNLDINFKGGYHAYMIQLQTNDNIKSVLDKIEGLQSANICKTKKQAQEIINQWNDNFKKNNVHAFN